MCHTLGDHDPLRPLFIWKIDRLHISTQQLIHWKLPRNGPTEINERETGAPFVADTLSQFRHTIKIIVWSFNPSVPEFLEF